MNQKQYARHRGVAPPTVSEWIRKGHLKGAFKRNGRVYEIDQPKADALLKERLHSSYRKRPDPQATGEKQREVVEAAGVADISFSEARAMKEKYLAALRKLEFEEKSGKLIPACDVEEIILRLVVATKTRFLGVPSKLGPLLSELVGDDKIANQAVAVIDSEIRSSLLELSREGDRISETYPGDEGEP